MTTFAVVGVGLILLMGCATQTDIATPLPESWEVRPPPSGTPEAVAAFSGIWVGRWEKGWSVDGAWSVNTAHTLVVERVVQASVDTYRAHVIYGWAGTRSATPEGSFRTVGTITPDGVLRLQRFPDGRDHTYTLSEDRRTMSFDTKGHWRNYYMVVSGTLWRHQQR